MAKVVALTADLLFGSQLQGALAAAGHELRMLADPRAVRDALTNDADGERPAVLLLDLTDGAGAIDALSAAGLLDGEVPTLAYYSHVEAQVRERAQAAGVTMVVPRSRMAREAAELVTGLATRP